MKKKKDYLNKAIPANVFLTSKQLELFEKMEEDSRILFNLSVNNGMKYLLSENYPMKDKQFEKLVEINYKKLGKKQALHSQSVQKLIGQVYSSFTTSNGYRAKQYKINKAIEAKVQGTASLKQLEFLESWDNPKDYGKLNFQRTSFNGSITFKGNGAATTLEIQDDSTVNLPILGNVKIKRGHRIAKEIEGGVSEVIMKRHNG